MPAKPTLSLDFSPHRALGIRTNRLGRTTPALAFSMHGRRSGCPMSRVRIGACLLQGDRLRLRIVLRDDDRRAVGEDFGHGLVNL